MLPTSHAVPIMSLGVDTAPSPQLLADAFSEFISASAVLESSYRELQEEVARLSSDLSQRNAALSRSLKENDRMRAALQQMLDSLPCGILVLDRAERIVMINPEGRRLLELGTAPVRSLKKLTELSGIDFDALAKGPAGPFDSEVSLRSGLGERWLAISHRTLDGTAGSDEFAHDKDQLQGIWILRDITLSKQAERERERARRATTLAEISTVLAHEIKNPLASMELFAGLIEQEPDHASQWISHLRAGIRTLSGTVNNVLSLNGESKLRLIPVWLGHCVESGVEFVRPIAQQAGVALHFANESAAIQVLGNEDAIRQIILNVVTNAIRHTEPGGGVSVFMRTGKMGSANRATVAIKDTGCGISESVVSRIFEAGFSGSGETPGLGLAVCKRLMKQHGGEIRVASQVNQGTSIELEFPTL
jgi:two-component system sensor histidine kinase FlrB